MPRRLMGQNHLILLNTAKKTKSKVKKNFRLYWKHTSENQIAQLEMSYLIRKYHSN